jgi:FKBP-type peptidyl-prolyl cis-trans isomerase
VSASVHTLARVSSLLTIISTTTAAATAIADDVAVTKKPKKVKVQETSLGINYIELKKGSGAYPSKGDFVVINYTGFLSDGKVFDSTDVKGRKPLSFVFGKNQVIPGLESVIENLQPGAEATCTIPAKYAYGAKGVCIEGEGCLVPPNETLKYVIKVKTVAAGYS